MSQSSGVTESTFGRNKPQGTQVLQPSMMSFVMLESRTVHWDVMAAAV